jgi:hypothetical protein
MGLDAIIIHTCSAGYYGFFALIIESRRQQSYVLKMSGKRRNYVRQQSEKLNNSVLRPNKK